jgi:hypothetical protein
MNTFNRDVYFFLVNSLNSVLISLCNRANLFVDEIVIRKSQYINIFNLLVIAIVVVSIISFFCIYYSYIAIIKRKEGYLEVFFEIGEEVIEKSLKICVSYCKKMNKDNFQIDDVEDEDISDDGEKKEEEKDNKKKETHTQSNFNLFRTTNI